MEYQIIHDWSKWAKYGVLPKRPHCTLDFSWNTRTLSTFFSEEELLHFDRRIAALSQEYPLNGQMFKLRYLEGMTNIRIARELHTTSQRVRRMIEFFVRQLPPTNLNSFRL